MKEFLLIFRMDITTPELQPTIEQMNQYMNQWMTWIDWITSSGQLADGGNHLSAEGYVLRSNDWLMDGPYTVNNESVAGYIIVLAGDLREAISIAQRCPILNGEGTAVEVREIAALQS